MKIWWPIFLWGFKMAQEIKEIFFYTSHGLKIAGDIYLPDSYKANKLFPAIVLCQGLSGLRQKVLPHVATAFSEKGFITLTFNYRGCGDSEGDPTRLFPLERVEDVLHAITFLQNYQGVDPERIGLYGTSYGASVGLYAAALHQKVKCAVAVSGAVDGEDFMRSLRTNEQWLSFKERLNLDRIKRTTTGQSELCAINEIVPFSENFWQKYKQLLNKNDSESIPAATNNSMAMFSLESAEAMTHFNVSSVVDQLSPRPIMIIHGEIDDVIAIEDVLKVYNHIHSIKDFVCLTHQDHIDLDNGAGLARQISYSLNWFNLYLA